MINVKWISAPGTRETLSGNQREFLKSPSVRGVEGSDDSHKSLRSPTALSGGKSLIRANANHLPNQSMLS